MERVINKNLAKRKYYIDLGLVAIYLGLLYFASLLLPRTEGEAISIGFTKEAYILRYIIWFSIGLFFLVGIQFVNLNQGIDKYVTIIAVLGIATNLFKLIYWRTRFPLLPKNGHVELLILAAILYNSYWISQKIDKVNIFEMPDFFFGYSVIVGLFGGLIAIATDLSSSLIVFFTSMSLLALAGWPILQIFTLGFVSTVLGTIIVAIRKPQAFINIQEYGTYLVTSWSEPKYLSTHLKAAFDDMLAGNLLGSEFSTSFNAPLPFTHSVFAVIVNQFGIIGGVTVLCLFMLLIFRGYNIAKSSPNKYLSILAIGITVNFATRVFLHVGSLVGLIPFTGENLPILSLTYGNFMFSCIYIGLLLKISSIGKQMSITKITY